MANKRLFSTVSKAPASNAKNDAGGRAYATSAEYQLAQYAVTGTFNGTYYVSGKDHLERVKALALDASPEFLAKLAVYGHQEGKMKDFPAFCLAVLAAKGELDYLKLAWPKVITNVKMLLNFVQIIRSGVLGRKSFGSAVKRLIQNWITSRNGKQLMMAKIGHSQPSLADVIKMVHPRPSNEEQDSTLAYIVGKPYNPNDLPKIIVDFEAFKKDNSNPVPDLPFRALTNSGLTDSHWKEIAENMPWNTLRMNLNTLARNNVFNDKVLTDRLASKLKDPANVKRWNAFPYQLLAAFKNVGDDVPMSIKLALQDAMEIATENVPDFGDVVVCPDLSGSMNSPVTGYRGNGNDTKVTCVDVAALTAAVILRKNPDAKILAWASSLKELKLNPRDSIMTNSQKMAGTGVGYGTNASLPLAHLEKSKWKGDAIIVLSDFQSWMDPVFKGSATGIGQHWHKISRRNKKAKLIGVNMASSDTVQAKDSDSVLNVAGFSDKVFNVVDNFVRGDKSHFVDVINKTEL